MIVLGLTGSIGMGKSTAAAMLRRLGVPVHDADACVHRLLGRGGAAVRPVGAAFPGTLGSAGIDRHELGRRVFGDAAALRRLERILHPMVRAEEQRFLRRMTARRVPLAVLDIPLLFETGGEARCDAVIVVTAPPSLQRARVLARPGMTGERLAAILAKQVPDRDKRRRADFVVPTGAGRAATLRHLAEIVRIMKSRVGGTRRRAGRGRRTLRHGPRRGLYAGNRIGYRDDRS
ncbi:MAG: dephospho-CoA kinase [Alphaproteobacteria bacterium]|nr:dephospho-CoA kinase [Alphaproteobacteria bacterium]